MTSTARHALGPAARCVVAALAVLAFLALAPSANAAITSVFSSTPAPIPCAVQGSGVRLCDQTIAGNPGGTARSTVQDLRRRADRRAGRLPARARQRAGRAVPADHAVPRLRGLEALACEHAAVPQRRLRDVQHDHARLRPVMRHHRRPHRRPDGVHRRPRAPDGHPLRGARRPGARRPAGRRGPHVVHADRRDRRLLRRRHVDGARGPQEPQDASGRLADAHGRARTGRRCRSRRPRRRSRGRTCPTRSSRTAARSTTSPTRPTWAAPGC